MPPNLINILRFSIAQLQNPTTGRSLELEVSQIRHDYSVVDKGRSLGCQDELETAGRLAAEHVESVSLDDKVLELKMRRWICEAAVLSVVRVVRLDYEDEEAVERQSGQFVFAVEVDDKVDVGDFGERF